MARGIDGAVGGGCVRDEGTRGGGGDVGTVDGMLLLRLSCPRTRRTRRPALGTCRILLTARLVHMRVAECPPTLPCPSPPDSRAAISRTDPLSRTSPASSFNSSFPPRQTKTHVSTRARTDHPNPPTAPPPSTAVRSLHPRKRKINHPPPLPSSPPPTRFHSVFVAFRRANPWGCCWGAGGGRDGNLQTQFQTYPSLSLLGGWTTVLRTYLPTYLS